VPRLMGRTTITESRDLCYGSARNSRHMKLSALLAILLTLAASPLLAGDERHHVHGGAAADADWYPDLKRPDNGQSCCGNRDCRLSSYCLTDQIGEGVVIGDRCLPLPYDRIIPPPLGVILAPGEVHVCARGDRILCVVGGAGV
jgi:hypothetical protein